MRANDFNFPYPVLGVPGSVLGEAPEVRMAEHLPLKERVADPYRWDFDIEIKDADILKLIADGKAQYMCEVMCSATLLRKCIFSDTGHIEVELQRREVNKRVEFGLYVVAKERIAEYRNQNANPDYRELEPFDIGKGSPLAIIRFYHWDADLCYEDLTSLRSILQFVKNTSNPKEEYIHVDTEGPYIKVEIPEAQFDAFMGVSREPKVAEVIHSSIVLFALQSALTVFDTAKSHRWERAIEAMVFRDDRFREYTLGAKDDAAQIALMLMNNPFKRLGAALPALAAGAVAQSSNASEEDGEDD